LTAQGDSIAKTIALFSDYKYSAEELATLSEDEL